MNKNISDLNIMVTGSGGDIGFGVGKILKLKGYGYKLVGTDISDNNGALGIFDAFEVVPRADSKDYLLKIRELIKKYKIDLIIPVTESELEVFVENKLIDCIDNVPVVSADINSVTIGLDKLKTAEFLKTSKLPFPWTQIVKEGKPKNIPCIIKSRVGHGSKDVAIVEEDMVNAYCQNRPDDIFQELLLPEDQEYTCGVFRADDVSTRTISFRRKLQGGYTGSGEVVEDERINQILVDLADKLQLKGSINVQLRLTSNGPVIFEINPRFSSTLVFRHKLGFEDLIWSINDKFGIEIDDYIAVPCKTKIYRYSDEIIIYPRNK